MSARVAALLGATVLLLAPAARAEDVSRAEKDLTEARTSTDVLVGRLQAEKDKQEELTAPPAEAPPPTPYKKTLVLDSTIGALGFLGEFGKVAPPAPMMRVQLGYELLKWLMVYGEGELAFTDTSRRQSAPNTRTFAMYGFGGGARFSVRFTERFGIYAQGGIGMMKADIANNALGILGFKDAEDLGLYFAARLGVEWFQIDRHFALGLTGGVRNAQGFAKIGAGTDSPLAIDGGVALRYAF